MECTPMDDFPEEYNVTCEVEGSFCLQNSCNKYYDCIWNEYGELVPVLMECPKCLRFNEKVGYCDFPYNVPRCLKPSLRPDIECVASGNFSIPGLCQQFKECIFYNNSFEVKIHTCPDDKSFNNITKMCDDSICDYNWEYNCTSPGYFLDEDKCYEFYECILVENEYNVKKFRCPPGLVFDEDIGACNLPTKVRGCKQAFR